MKNLKKLVLTLSFILLIFCCKTTDQKNKELDKNASEQIAAEKAASSKTATDNTLEIHKVPETSETSTTSSKLETSQQNRITIKERSDYRTYINEKYVGLTYRETEIYLQQNNTADGRNFSGKAFVIQDTRRNMVSHLKKIDEVLQIDFVKTNNGAEKFTSDNGLPLLREFFDSLNLDYKNLEVGTCWNDSAIVSIFPLKERGVAILPTKVYYEYVGLTNYFGQEVYKVQGKYALRNNSNAHFSKIAGGRHVEIFLSTKDNSVLFVREKTQEQFTYNDGITVRNEGVLLHFYNYADTTQTITKNQKNKITKIETFDPKTNDKNQSTKIELPESENYSVENTDIGLKLNLQNLHFVANSPKLLHNEGSKLDEIAQILKKFADKKFFVEGHTAGTGRFADEKSLSEQRAFVVVTELVKRGIPAANFLYSGAGATKPLADNNTYEGMAKNRRVEITILEN